MCYASFYFSPFILLYDFLNINRYIDEDDLLRFMIKEEVNLVFPLLEGSETGRIDRKALTNWVVMDFMFVHLKFFVSCRGSKLYLIWKSPIPSCLYCLGEGLSGTQSFGSCLK